MTAVTPSHPLGYTVMLVCLHMYVVEAFGTVEKTQRVIL